MFISSMAKQCLFPSNIGTGYKNFCTIDFGGAFFNCSYCVLRHVSFLTPLF